jgi:pimeloyl-ACP methyl ester carboxylesterase
MHTKRRALLAFLVGSIGIALGAPAAQADDPSSPVCGTRAVPVHIGLSSMTISGTYCRPSSGAPDTVFVLVPGATYDREYWDFGYQPQTYSFARALTRRGLATFAIDRLGTGQSSKPLSVTLTASLQADATHQVIGRLRGSGLDGHSFSRVLLGGHSLGSGVSLLEAATYRDVDGLLLTGFTHRLNVAKLVEIFAIDAYPALLDPMFAGTVLDPGYLTTHPGLRKKAFHDPGVVDPGVIARDEATKSVFSATEALDAAALGVILGYSQRITAPVLLAVGGQDTVFCVSASDCTSAAALRAQELPYYSGSPCLSTLVLPNVGHDLNLHPTAPVAQGRVADWADALAGGGCPT